MERETSTEAAARIAAASATDLFGVGAPSDADAARRARRTYRILVALVHPDVAGRDGLTAADAQAATVRLNALYESWQQRGAARPSTSAPHVVGAHGTYLLRAQVRAGAALATYRADGVFVTIARRPGARLDAFLEPLAALDAVGMAAFGPRVVDLGSVEGRPWAAWDVPDGLVSLADVRAAYPDGLDGRDWAWIARRILMTLDAAGRLRPHGTLNPDTVLIQPEAHGVVLTGWGEAGTRADDLHDLATLFAGMLRADETRQLRFAARATTLTPARFLAEYDLLLAHLYGPRRFRPFVMPTPA